MRSRSLVLGILALGAFGLTACSDESTTEPTRAAEPNPTAPELAVASNSWITRADMPNDQTDFASATVTNAAGQSIVYAIGGVRPTGVTIASVRAYSVATNTWTFRRSMPVAIYRTNGAAVLNGKIYVSGGYGSSEFPQPGNGLFVYDPATNTWTRKRTMPNPGAEGVTGVIDGKIYVVTLCDNFWEPQECGGPYIALYRYNPLTDRWVTLPAPPDVFTSLNGGGVIGGKLYVLGNLGPDGRFAVYDPATNRWSLKTPLIRARYGSGTATMAGKLYVVGGVRINLQDPRDTLAVTVTYDPTTDAWTSRAPMPRARLGITASTILRNGQARIEVVGGAVPGNNLQYVP